MYAEIEFYLRREIEQCLAVYQDCGEERDQRER